MKEALENMSNIAWDLYTIKLLTSIISPPGIFVIAFVIVSIYCAIKNGPWKAMFFLTMIFYLFTTNFLANALTMPLETQYQQTKYPMGDVIVVLGAGSIGGVPDLNGEGVLSAIGTSRLMTGARLQRKLNIPILVSGGRVFADGAVEANIAQRELLDLGIASDMVYAENQSRNTKEMAENIKRVCANKGWEKIILVTSAVNMPRAIKYVNKEDLSYEAVPCEYRASRIDKITWDDFLPSVGAIAESSSALKEYIGNLTAMVRGH